MRPLPSVGEVVARVGRMSFGYPLASWGAFVEARPVDGVTVEIRAGFQKAPHRDTGKPGPVITLARLHSGVLVPEFIAQTVEQLLKDLLVHELHESMLLDGIRFRDPHAVVKP